MNRRLTEEYPHSHEKYQLEVVGEWCCDKLLAFASHLIPETWLDQNSLYFLVVVQFYLSFDCPHDPPCTHSQESERKQKPLHQSQVLSPGLKVIVPDSDLQHCLQCRHSVALVDPHIPENDKEHYGIIRNPAELASITGPSWGTT